MKRQPISCESAEVLIQELLDERGVSLPDSDPQLAAHLDDCAACRQLALDYQTVFASFYDQHKPPKEPAVSVRRPLNETVLKWSLSAVAVAVLFVMPVAWSWQEFSRTQSMATNVATSGDAAWGMSSVTDSQTVSILSADETLLSDEMVSANKETSVASILNVGKVFNTLSWSAWNADDEDGRGDDHDQSVGDTPVTNLLAMVLPTQQTSGMPGSSMKFDTMSLETMKSADTIDLTMPIHFEQPTFKSFFRVCANPFSQS